MIKTRHRTHVAKQPAPGNVREDQGVQPPAEQPPKARTARPRLVNAPKLEAAAPKGPTPQEERAAVTAALAGIKTADDVRALRLPDLSSHLVAADVGEVLGGSPQSMMDKFGLSTDPVTGGAGMSAADRNRITGAWELSKTLLQELADHTLAPVTSGDQRLLDWERLSVGPGGRFNAVIAQHTGYVADRLSRDPEVVPPIDREAARIVLRAYFAGELKATRAGANQTPRELLADELSKLGGGDAIKNLVLTEKTDGSDMFAIKQALAPSSVMSNMGAVHAGEATLELAAQLVGEQSSAAFVKHVFERPSSELVQMLQFPRGAEGILLHFAVTADHLAWECAKLGDATLDARKATPESDATALAKATHKDLGPTVRKVYEDADAANKLTTQISSFLINLGELVPRGTSGGIDKLDLHAMLDDIARNGKFSDKKLPILSPFAASVQRKLAQDLRQAAKLSDWHLSGELAANTVAHVCAAFGAYAVDADFAQKDKLTRAFRNALASMRVEFDKMISTGEPRKTDADYEAFYQDRGGEVSFRALHEFMGEASRGVVRRGTFADLIPQALANLRLADSGDYTSKNLIADLRELQQTLLADDYFMKQPGFMDELDLEAVKPKSDVDPKGLEAAVRFPNAQWMWLLMIRGLVEDKLGRLEGSQSAAMQSDKFPDSVQFNPPDVRDVELFKWARYRLMTGHDIEARKADRMALSLVVFTLYKDLLQVRKGAAM